jgi:rhomboid protease GluP
VLGRQTSGSVVCPSCGKLVGVHDAKCFHCGRPHPGMWGFAPLLRHLGQDFGFGSVVIGGSVLLYLAMLAVDPSGVKMGGLLSMLAPSNGAMRLFGASGFVPVVVEGRWWTLLSAGWLHAGLLHILFNMLWVRQLAPPLAELYGPGRAVLIYTVSGVCGFTMSSFAPFLPRIFTAIMGVGAVTLGASAALFGILGALVHYSRRVGHSAMGQQVWVWAIALFAFGFVMRGIDNWAHLGGFAGGWVMSHWLDPLKPERGDHLIAGLLALALSAAAIVASVVTGLSAS